MVKIKFCILFILNLKSLHIFPFLFMYSNLAILCLYISNSILKHRVNYYPIQNQVDDKIFIKIEVIKIQFFRFKIMQVILLFDQ